MINILSADILGPLTFSLITVYMPRCHEVVVAVFTYCGCYLIPRR